MAQCGGNKKGLNIESFDRLVDTLVTSLFPLDIFWSCFLIVIIPFTG
jgi:hypothetical protein